LTPAEVKADVRRIAKDCDRLAKLAEERLVDQEGKIGRKNSVGYYSLPSSPPLPSRNFIVAIADPGGTRGEAGKKGRRTVLRPFAMG